MPVRVLFPFAGVSVIGGSHISALKLAAALDRRRFEPYVLIHNCSAAAGSYAESLDLPVEVLEKPAVLGSRYFRKAEDAGPLRYLGRTLPQLLAALARINPDIVHTNDGLMHTNWVFPAKLSGRKHLWHHRADPGAFGINKLAPVLSDHIVSVSHFSKPAHPVRGVDHKFTVVRSPFDFPDPRPCRVHCRAAILAELALPGDAVLLGYFGNLTTRKRPLHFIQAVQAVQQALPERAVHGLLFGSEVRQEDRMEARCRALAREQGLEERIHLMGFREQAEHYMAGMDALLVSALDEPFGRTLIEAMYLGTPVVATRHGGNPEAIMDGETGFLVDPADPAAFAPPVAQLVRDPGLFARIAEAAHREAAANYGRRRHVEAISAIYDQLLQGPQGGVQRARRRQSAGHD